MMADEEYIYFSREEFEWWAERLAGDKASRHTAFLDLHHFATPLGENIDLERPLRVARQAIRKNKRSMATRWGWTTGKVDRFLNLLQEMGRLVLSDEGADLRVPLYFRHKVPKQRRGGSGVSAKVRAEILRDAACVDCGSVENLSVDHIMPVALGGSHRRENLQPMCRSCNSRKGAKHPREWRGE